MAVIFVSKSRACLIDDQFFLRVYILYQGITPMAYRPWTTGVARAPPPPHRAEPKWYQRDRMDVLVQNRDIPIK